MCISDNHKIEIILNIKKKFDAGMKCCQIMNMAGRTDGNSCQWPWFNLTPHKLEFKD